MKNTLLTTTALALTSFAGTASAVEVAAGPVNLEIGGFFRITSAFSNVEIGVGETNAGADYDGLDILTDSEIHFKPSITLDNGIKIGADVELEGNSSKGKDKGEEGDQIDEATIFAEGGFGKVELGSRDSAGKLMQVSAPDVSMVYANSSSLSAFVPFTGPTTTSDFANDADRLTYFTPNFGGFTLGVSYARDKSQTKGAVNNNSLNDDPEDAEEEGFGTDYADIGVTYQATVGEVGIGFSARYGTYDSGFNGAAHAAALNSATAAAIAAAGDGALYKSDAIAAAAADTTAAATATTAAATATTDTAADTTAADALDDGVIKTAATEAAVAGVAAALTATEAAAALTAAAATATTAAAALTGADATAAATAAYTTSTANINRAAARNPTVGGVGLSVSFADFAIGGGYVEVDSDIVGLSNAKTYDIGVSYANGPMGYSLTYVRGEEAGNVADLTSIVAAATYTVNPTFKIGASLASYEKDVTGDTNGDIDGQVLALSAQFDF